jgi:hypothetical protein
MNKIKLLLLELIVHCHESFSVMNTVEDQASAAARTDHQVVHCYESTELSEINKVKLLLLQRSTTEKE